jgi:ATP-dependent protease ClpP protease subunit
MYDFLSTLPCVVRTHACGSIMSMGLIVFLAGDERYSQKNTTFMNHSVSSAIEGKLADIKIDSKEVERLNDVCNEILAEKTNMKKDWWKKHIEFKDQYYDFSKALELGIITHQEEEE